MGDEAVLYGDRHSSIKQGGFPFPMDVYGDMMATLVTSTEDPRSRGIPTGRRWLWVLMSTIIFLANGTLQLGLSFALFATAIEAKEDPFENGMPERIAELKSALLTTTQLPSHGNTTVSSLSGTSTYELCSKQRTWPAVYYGVLTLWYARMVQELFDAFLFAFAVLSVPSLEDDDSDDSSEIELLSDGNGYVKRGRLVESTTSSAGVVSHKVVRFTSGLRIVIMVIIVVPKVLVALWISWLGGKFLILGRENANVILKALCLQYFVGIDELLFKSFVSDAMKREVASMQLCYEIRCDTTEWDHWGGSVARIAITVATVVLVSLTVFGDLTDFRYLCWEYFELYPPASPTPFAGLTYLLF